MLWSGQDTAQFHDSVKYLAVMAAIVGARLTTEPPGQYFMADGLNPQRLKAGCQYRLSYRPVEFGKAFMRSDHSRIA